MFFSHYTTVFDRVAQKVSHALLIDQKFAPNRIKA